MANIRTQIRWIENELQALGAQHEIERTGSGHIAVKIEGRAGTRTVFTSATPSDRRAINNFRSQLRRVFRELNP